MKKFISIFTMFLMAFTLSVNAQESTEVKVIDNDQIVPGDIHYTTLELAEDVGIGYTTLELAEGIGIYTLIDIQPNVVVHVLDDGLNLEGDLAYIPDDIIRPIKNRSVSAYELNKMIAWADPDNGQKTKEEASEWGSEVVESTAQLEGSGTADDYLKLRGDGTIEKPYKLPKKKSLTKVKETPTITTSSDLPDPPSDDASPDIVKFSKWYYALYGVLVWLGGALGKVFGLKKLVPKYVYIVIAFGIVLAGGFIWYGFDFMMLAITLASTLGIYDALAPLVKKKKVATE